MDLSNKALALVLVVATSISLLGTILAVSKMSEVGSVYVTTGRALTDTANANFSITSQISIVFTTNLVDFGVGVVNGSGAHNCTLNTSGPAMLAGSPNPVNGPDCVGFNATLDPLRIQNQGTQNVSLNISFNATNAVFIGGTTPELSYKVSLNETNSCYAAALNTTFVKVTTIGNFTVCNSTGFNWGVGARTLNIDLGMRIPQDAPSGGRKLAITAFAY